MVSLWCSTKDYNKRFWDRKVYHSQVLEGVHGMPQRATGRSRQGAGREKHMLL